MVFDAHEPNIEPLYVRVKRFVLEGIARGDWKPTDRLPSENELVTRLDVSRMTAHRALRELTDEGFLVRIAGVGTFVADRTPHGDLVQIQNLADEITRRGHRHHMRVLEHSRVRADAALARAFEFNPGTTLFHARVVHYEGEQPLQYEDRHVNPTIAPEFLKADLEHVTAHAHLMAVAPLQQAEHVVEAVHAPFEIATVLDMSVDEPCLLLTRRTWTDGVVASHTRLYHPGSRYRLGGRIDFTRA